MDKKQIYEGKREWAARRMLENAKIETLTEKQHEVLEWLCTVRHELHTNKDSVWNENSDALKPFENFCGDCEVNQRLKEVGLKPIELNFDCFTCPTVSDFYECLKSEEREEWEEKAVQYNAENPGGMLHNGLSLWREKSGKYRDFLDEMENINNQVEKYLKEIDDVYSSNYCPSGYTRLY